MFQTPQFIFKKTVVYSYSLVLWVRWCQYLPMNCQLSGLVCTELLIQNKYLFLNILQLTYILFQLNMNN